MPNKFVIPKAIANWRLKSLPRSSSLSAVLRILKVRRLNDLAKLTHEDIKRVTTDGERFVLELTKLIEHAASGGLREPEAKRRFAATRVADERIQVARAISRIEVSDLPLSVRLQGVLQRKAVQRLGDLDQVAYCDLRRMDNCGRKTINELRAILDRLNADDSALLPRAQEKVTPSALLAQLDALLAQLPKRDLEILTSRLGAESGEPATLESIGRRFGMTRERVRQIVELLPEKVRRSGGPKLKVMISGLGLSKDRPLDTARLRSLAPKPWRFRYQPSFYLRLLTALQPDLPGIQLD